MSEKMKKLNWIKPLVTGFSALVTSVQCTCNKTETGGERLADRKQCPFSASNKTSLRTMLDGLKIMWQSSDVIRVFGGTLANVRFTNTSSTEDSWIWE